MKEHTHIHAIHLIATVLMVAWGLALLTLIAARWPDNSFTRTMRELVPLGTLASSAETPTVTLENAA